MKTKYSVICIDPPYSFSDTLSQNDVKRGAAANYSTLSMNDLQQLKIKELSDPTGAIIALWVPSSLLKEGLSLLDAWGFKHKQTYIWVKVKKDIFKELKSLIKKANFIDLLNILNNPVKFVNETMSFGMGRLFRQSHEFCLIGINNNKIYKKLKNKSQRSVSFDVNYKHSQKPESLQNSLELMFPNEQGKMIEIFSRRQRNNWICIGNQCVSTLGQDIRYSIENLL